jgi:hypothetical protein
MGFFDWIYGLKFFYGAELFEHLKGWDDSMMGYNPDYNQFPYIFGSIMFICVVMFALYYYIINHPRLNRWWFWLSDFVAILIMSYVWGYYMVRTDIVRGNIAPSLIDKIGNINAISFGIYNVILAALIYLLMTLLLRHWSRNCKHSPWISWNKR